MRVVLDASAIIAAGVTLGSPVYRSIAAAATDLGIVVCVPQVVVEEVSNHYRERLEEERIKVRDGVRRFSSLTASGLAEPITEAMVHDQVAAHRTKILAWVNEIGGRVLDYPDIPHSVIAGLDLARAKPFNREGKGYRDALIW